MGKPRPLDDSCSNSGFSDRWTSPCCYAEIRETKPGVHLCPECGRRVSCSLAYEPVCRSFLMDEEDPE